MAKGKDTEAEVGHNSSKTLNEGIKKIQAKKQEIALINDDIKEIKSEMVAQCDVSKKAINHVLSVLSLDSDTRSEFYEEVEQILSSTGAQLKLPFERAEAEQKKAA